MPLDTEEGTQESPLDSAEETRKTPSDREDKAQRKWSDPEEETVEAPLNSVEKTEYVAGLAEGPTELEGPVVPARRKVTIGGNLPSNNVKVHLE